MDPTFQIDHLGIAVKSLAAAKSIYEKLGLAVSPEETVEQEHVRLVMVPVGESRLELLEATSEDSTIAKFIAKRGEGLHHVCLKVPDLHGSGRPPQARWRAPGLRRNQNWRGRASICLRASRQARAACCWSWCKAKTTAAADFHGFTRINLNRKMFFLVTDTSGKNGIVALARADEPANARHEVTIIETVPLAGGTFSAQLVPQIAALLAKHNLSKADLEAFIVVSGPGSFTGLRVGLAAIKALAEILKKPIVPVSLLEATALAAHAQGKIAAVLDAGRGDVYFASYDIATASTHVLQEGLLSKQEFLTAARGSTLATPDATLAAAAREASLNVVTVEPADAGSIARLGWRRLRSGETVSPERLEANYMRRSDAELFAKSKLLTVSQKD